MSAVKNKQYTHTVTNRPERNMVIMQNPGPSYISYTEDSVTRYVNTGPPSPGHNVSVSQRQHVVKNPHNNNELERRRILKRACLIDSDDDDEDETLQPQTQVQNLADT